MDRGDPELIERLFEQASALPPEEQEAFLEEACAGDPAAEAELRSLIAAAENAEGFFDSLADAVVSLSPWTRDEQESLSSKTEGPDPLIGRSVRQYRIESQLGRGGMGIVYRAHDTTLDRPVALKFLPRHVTGDEEAAERFLIEARAAAALDHPNVCTVYEIGENEDGRRFIAMAYYEGETLKQKLSKGPLPIEEAKEYARQIAAGLGAAHKRDIVHRDIKPGNVIVTPDGLVKVLDFGLAKLTDVTLTRTGTTLGTVAYMSPEQVRGKDVNYRTDLWSLGVVLYEMLTGERPFKGDSTAVVIHAIQEEEPQPVSTIRPEVEPELEAVVHRLMAKDPAERHQKATEVGHALGAPRPLVQVIGSRWRWLGLGAAAAAAGIAILLLSPFGSILDSDGVASAEPLAEIPVEPWTLLAQFEGTADSVHIIAFQAAVEVRLVQSGVVDPFPPDQIQLGLELAELPDTTTLRPSLARELAQRASIRTIVRGRLDRLGNTYSCVLRLEDAESGAALWSDQVIAAGDDELLPAFQLLADRLRAELGEREEDVQATRPLIQVRTGSYQAWKKYAEAERQRLLHNQWREWRYLLWEAVELDPGFAMAWLAIWVQGLSMPADSARFALEQARLHEDQMTEAERHYLEYIESGPIDAQRAALERAVRAQPNNTRWSLLLARLVEPETALGILERAEGMSPFGLYPRDRFLRALLLVRLGQTDSARQYVSQVEPEISRRHLLVLAAIRDADWTAADSLAVVPEDTPWPPSPVRVGGSQAGWASSHVVRGEIRIVLDWIDRSRKAHQPLKEAQARGYDSGVVFPRWARGYPAVEQLLRVVTEMLPLPNDSTCWQRSPQAIQGKPWGNVCFTGAAVEVTQEALEGDSVATRHALDAFIADTFTLPDWASWSVTRERLTRWSYYMDPRGVRVPFVETMIAYHARDWEAVVRIGDPILGLIWGSSDSLIRWMVADACEKLGRFERAAELFEPFATVDFDRVREIQLAGVAYPFAHYRLARIHTRLGDTARAIRHWTTFLDTFTRPDPEYEWMVEEGRVELRRLRRG